MTDGRPQYSRGASAAIVFISDVGGAHKVSLASIIQYQSHLPSTVPAGVGDGGVVGCRILIVVDVIYLYLLFHSRFLDPLAPR